MWVCADRGSDTATLNSHEKVALNKIVECLEQGSSLRARLMFVADLGVSTKGFVPV